MTLFGLQSWRLGLKSLAVHPLRSLLTVLGIFIGVASVIWLLAIGEGISRKAQQQIEDLGASNIIVRSIRPSKARTADTGFLLPYGLTRDDYDRIVQTIPTIKQALPIREMHRCRFGYQRRTTEGRLVGCTPEYAEVTRLAIARGRLLTDSDLHGKKNHCVLAATTAEQLFPFEDPIGRSVRLDEPTYEDYYVVVGVTKPRDPTAGIGGSLTGQDFNNDVYIPITTLWSRMGDMIITGRSGSIEGEIIELSQITLSIDTLDHVLATADLLRDTLARTHHTEDYGVTVPLELLEQARTTRLLFIIFMGLIATISLVVGGIGIMNIMLATVTERTREIGIRRALGAKRRDIIRQFLVETVSLSVLGGIAGVLGGLTCRPVFNQVRASLERALPDVMDQLPQVIKAVEPILVPESIPLAFGISVSIGVIFGLYPAMRAAAMDPIEALRHE